MTRRTQEIRNLGTDELKVKYNAFRQEIFNLYQQARVGKLEKPANIRHAKKDIARILTVLREKDIKI